MKKRRILISVTDKAGIEKFKALTDTGGWEIISTGGTAEALNAAGIPCTLIEDVTGFPEMMGGRLKTLHPKIFGGILADRDKPDHMEALATQGIETIDVVVVNLYAFEKNPGIENIDIGGPSLLRAAAKNGKHVAVVVNPDDYDQVIKEVLEGGEVTSGFKEDLAAKVFHHTSHYDEAIKQWMGCQPAGTVFTGSGDGH
jgi:phosphoribosylaminoimidazolecarboxamide formyltransferase/IMP cyclohydrolase